MAFDFNNVSKKSLEMFMLLLLSFIVNCASQNENYNMTAVKKTLEWKGYMSETEENDDEIVNEAIKAYQEYMELDVTGTMNQETWDAMHEPQCGVADITRQSGNGMSKRRRRYALGRDFWRKTTITYRIDSVPNRLNNDQESARAESEIRRAFEIWSNVSQLTFEHRRSGQVDILVSAEGRVHQEPPRTRPGGFDGPGMVLAHAYFPQIGTLHFDDDEPWVLGLTRGSFNLFLVAAHEVGHSLGLDHSIKGSLMHGSYNSRLDLGFPLHEDDILGIQSLYGSRRLSSTSTTTAQPNIFGRRTRRPSATSAPPPDLCQDSTLDAVTSTVDGRTFIFRNEYYWEINRTGIVEGYPKQIVDNWNGIVGPVDAAITAPDGITYLLQRDSYYRFRNQEPLTPFNGDIGSIFPRVPNDIDASFIWPVDGRMHFIQGTRIYRYQYNGKYNARQVTTLSNLRIMETKIDAAFTFNNTWTYFFSGKNYYRLSTNPARAATGYPKETATEFFGCKKRMSKELTDAKGNVFGHVFSRSTDGSGENHGNDMSGGKNNGNFGNRLYLSWIAVFIYPVIKLSLM